MAMPTDVGIIDTMIGFPHKDMKEVYAFITRQTKDRESKEDFAFPVEYMFKQVPEKEYLDVDDPISVTLHEMDRWGIEKGLIGVGDAGGVGELALKRHPDRFIPQAGADPNEGMEAVRKHRARVRDVRGAIGQHVPGRNVPAGRDQRQEDVSDLRQVRGARPPGVLLRGRSGPRLKFEPQRVEYIDEVMYDFPELVFVTRHGCEPWQDLAVKLMLKWPGLHYSTSAFAPKHYPKAIIDYANTRGADKIIYAGYFPMGLSIERIMTEMPNVGFKDDVWPKFLRGNAMRVLGLDG